MVQFNPLQNKSIFVLVFAIFELSIIATSQTCLLNGITFNTQGQVDSFPLNYPGCSQILGDVYVNGLNGGNITNLDSLIQITIIGGNLQIGYNQFLTNITGLNSLTTINGSNGLGLWIENNDQLLNLNGLNSVITINNRLDIINNDLLSSLSALGSLQSINGQLSINSNISLNSLVGIDNIDYTTINYLDINNSTQLSKCDVQSVCDFLTLGNNDFNISSNAIGCNNADEIETFCAGCPSNGLTFYTQNQIDSFPILFPGCNQIIGNVKINDLEPGNIKNLDSLSQLDVITGNLTIQENDSLNDLDGLLGSYMTYGVLNISDNAILTSLVGLNIHWEFTTNLIIQNCPNLSICDVQSICDYLQNPTHPNTISDNASGCETRGQVLAYCSDLDGDEIIDSLDNCVTVYNPLQEDADNDNVGDVCDYGTHLLISQGVIFVENNNGSILMRSPDNSCWILKVSNSGVLTATKVPCP